MADTVRSLSSLQTLLANNSTGDIGSQDLRDFLVSVYLNEVQANLENGKTTVDTPDDEFNSETLDGKWTVTDGTNGTVSLTQGSPADIYEITTDGLLTQMSAGNDFFMRQDYTLPDGNSIILSLNPTVTTPEIGQNDYFVGMSVNDNDSAFNAGNYHWFAFAPSSRVIAWDGSATSATGVSSTGHGMYLRVLRSGLTYSYYWSITGDMWNPIESNTESGAFTNIWLFTISEAAYNSSPVSINKFSWIRQGDNNIRPW
jgi:hypothetical protein